MDSEKTVKDAFIQVVEDHMASGDPPETKAAVETLIERGRSPGQAKQLVAGVVKVEMQEMLSTSRPFDSAKYAAGLKKLLASEV